MTTPHSSWAQHYDAAYAHSFGELYKALTETTLKCVMDIQPPPARIIDFGAGTGRLSLPLAKKGYTVVATDPCAEMLAVLRSKAEKQNVAVETVCCRMLDDFPSPQFDLALCVFTVLLYLLEEATLNASLARAAAVLRPGGHLLFDIPTEQLFHSYHRTTAGFERDVRVTRESAVLFRYEEATRIFDGDVQVSYMDSFQIRHWQQSQILSALAHAGFEVKADLSSQFAGTGSHYFLARLCATDAALQSRYQP